MRNMPLSTRLLIALALVGACSDDPTTTSQRFGDSAVVAIVDNATLIVRNASTTTVRAAALERQWGENGLALWCFGSAECGRAIEPGSEWRVPLVDVEGYRADMSQVLVRWWAPSEANDEGAAPVNTVLVRLR
jgi:hypothetical protein